MKHIEHIVVLMLENRSFDHMLGYLSLPAPLGSGRQDIDGLQGNEVNIVNNTPYPAFSLTGYTYEHNHRSYPGNMFIFDPPHDYDSVKRQVEDRTGGFVSTFMDAHPSLSPDQAGLIMGYYTAADLPVFDFLIQNYCVCDRWFSSLPGPTWPNRVYSLSGTSAGKRDNKARLYHTKTIFHHLKDKIKWRYYHYPEEPPFLLLFSRHLPAAGVPLWESGMDSLDDFFRHAERGDLPNVVWVDPNFRVISPRPQNDDHPPADVRDGQQFVADIYEALLNGGRNLWEKTVLIITYDEHGGFFDHVDPRTFPAAPDRRGFDRYGIRVPTLIVSPWVEPGSVSHTIFDHTSILKTILKRFGKKGVKMSARVEASHDLWELLEGQTAPRSDRLSLPTTSIAAAPMLSLMGVDTADLQDSNRRLYDDLPPTDLQKNLLKQIGIAEVSPRQLKPR